jgi:hypothetical protein
MAQSSWIHIARLVLLSAVLIVVLCGCAQHKGADPGPQALRSGQTCDSIHRELSDLDRAGIRDKFDRDARGTKLRLADRRHLARYRDLLDQYLGARCHA